MRITALGMAAVLWLWGGAAAVATELAVGAGREFARVADAVARAAPGDTILVHARADGRPYEQTAVLVNTPRLLIKGVPGPEGRRPVLSGKGFDFSGRGSVPRAIFQFDKDADGCTLEGFELTGAHNESHNGAGVRINEANGVAVRDCRIHANDMGIMSNGDGTDGSAMDQFVAGCLIESNGDPAEPGYNHNLYLGGAGATLLGCEVRTSLAGHNVKSRARRTVVLACFIHDAHDRELDLVDARGDTTRPDSNAYLVGTIIAKDPRCGGNRAVVHFGTDGGVEHDGTVYAVNNTIVTPFVSPVVTLSAPKARACLVNNIVWDGGSGRRGQVLVDAARTAAGKAAVQGQRNWLAGGFAGDAANWNLEATVLAAQGESPPFIAAAKGDYRLARRDTSITAAGVRWDSLFTAPAGCRFVEYAPPLAWRQRPDGDKPDLGACRWGGGEGR